MNTNPTVTLLTFPDGSKFELPLVEVQNAEAPALRAAIVNAVNEYNSSADVPFDLAGALTMADSAIAAAKQLQVAPEAAGEDTQDAVDANMGAALAAALGDDVEEDDKVPLAEFAKADDISPVSATENAYADKGNPVGTVKDPFHHGAEEERRGDGTLMPDPGREGLVPGSDVKGVTSGNPEPVDGAPSVTEILETLTKHRSFSAHAGAFNSLGYRGDVSRAIETSINVLDCMAVELSGNRPDKVGAVRAAIARELGIL